MKLSISRSYLLCLSCVPVLALGLALGGGLGCADDSGGGPSQTSGGAGPATGNAASTLDSGPGSSTAAGGSSGTGEVVADFTPELLACPLPAAYPFTPESSGFEQASSQTTAADNPRFKDSAADQIGVPGGVVASTLLAQADAPAVGAFGYAGTRGRAMNATGTLVEPLAGEFVSLWTYDGEQWAQLARGLTDATGSYAFDDVTPSPNPAQPVYAVLEADGTCVPHIGFMHPEGSKIVVSDIDGTLTQSDAEFNMQISDGLYDPLEYAAASTMMNTWADKGYSIIYLTARPHVFRAETRQWLDSHGFPSGVVLTAEGLVFGDTAAAYKATWVGRAITDFGWDIVAAYGNAGSDIDGYEAAGVDKSITFIIGKNAGNNGTQTIVGDDYTDHIAEFVEPMPPA